MFKGLYTVASGMIAQQRHQEALSNNIANANTPGYKADQTTFRAFPEMLMNEINTKHPIKYGANIPTKRPIGGLFTGVYAQEFVTDFSEGALRETGMDTDLALVQQEIPDDAGGFFFAVQNEAGEVRLTRNGNFTVDGDGFLVTSEGYYVLGEDGNPTFTNGLDFTVSDEGLLQTADQSTLLDIRYVENVHDLEKEGNGLLNGESNPIPNEATFHVKQGFLERSNVDSLQAMTQMMEAYRAFETNQRVLKAYDESMGKAVNDIGRIG